MKKDRFTESEIVKTVKRLEGGRKPNGIVQVYVSVIYLPMQCGKLSLNQGITV